MTNNIEKNNIIENVKLIKDKAKILATIKKASTHEQTIASVYFTCFVSAMHHALEHKDHSLLTDAINCIDSKSKYKSRIIKWVSENSPLHFSKINKKFVIKQYDNKKMKWSAKQIETAIENPFYTSSTNKKIAEDVTAEDIIDSSIKTLEKSLKRITDVGGNPFSLQEAVKVLKKQSITVDSDVIDITEVPLKLQAKSKTMESVTKH